MLGVGCGGAGKAESDRAKSENEGRQDGRRSRAVCQVLGGSHLSKHAPDPLGAGAWRAWAWKGSYHAPFGSRNADGCTRPVGENAGRLGRGGNRRGGWEKASGRTARVHTTDGTSRRKGKRHAQAVGLRSNRPTHEHTSVRDGDSKATAQETGHLSEAPTPRLRGVGARGELTRAWCPSCCRQRRNPCRRRRRQRP